MTPEGKLRTWMKMTRYPLAAAGAWFSPDDAAWKRDVPIALVTLRLDDAIDDAALGFLEGAEQQALDALAASGMLLMALVSQSRRELNLVIACDDDEARRRAAELPSAVSELAAVEVRSVTALSLTGARKLVMH